MSEIRTETGTRRGKRPGWKKWLWILPGVLLILWGAVMLERVPDVGQYVFLPGAEDKAPAGSGTVRKSIPWLQKLTETEQEWGNAFPADSLHGTAEGVSLKTGVVTVDQVTVTETLGDYFGVYPRAFTAGRPLADASLADRLAAREPLYEQTAHVIIDTDGLSPDEVADEIIISSL